MYREHKRAWIISSLSFVFSCSLSQHCHSGQKSSHKSRKWFFQIMFLGFLYDCQYPKVRTLLCSFRILFNTYESVTFKMTHFAFINKGQIPCVIILIFALIVKCKMCHFECQGLIHIYSLERFFCELFNDALGKFVSFAIFRLQEKM